MRILIVDDNKVNQMIVEKILDAAGYTNHASFSSARELFVCLQLDNERPNVPENPPDLILMDLMMPGVDGIEACRRLQKSSLFRDIPIIIVTALGDSLKLAEALDAGATDYVMKPINKVELIARIRAALRLKVELDWHRTKERELAMELELAKQVQESVLSAPVAADRFRLEAMYKPSKVLAGDFYAWYPVGGGRYGIILLDMMGHGISSSLMCMYIASVLQDTVMKNPDPVRVIEVLNRYMCRLHGKEQWIRYYFTAIYLLFDPEKRTIEYVNAGHPPGLLLADGNRLHQLDCGTCAVGFDETARVEKAVITYEERAKLLLFTDGFLEVISPDWDGASARIAKALTEGTEGGPAAFAASLAGDDAEEGQQDDQCLVMLEAGPGLLPGGGGGAV